MRAVTESVLSELSVNGERPQLSLATVTKSVPQMQGITSRWLLRVLPWVEAGQPADQVVLIAHHKVTLPYLRAVCSQRHRAANSTSCGQTAVRVRESTVYNGSPPVGDGFLLRVQGHAGRVTAQGFGEEGQRAEA